MERATEGDSIATRWADAVRRLSATDNNGDGLEPAQGQSALQWAAALGLEPELQARALAEVLGIRFASELSGLEPLPDFIARVPIIFARQHGVLAFAGDDGPVLALSDLSAWSQIDVLSRYLGCQLQPIVVPHAAIVAAINDAYEQRTGQTQEVIEALDKEQVLEEVKRYQPREDLLDVSDRAPVIKLVSTLLFEAVKLNASDVHIQPYEDRLVARLRIDGVLFDSFEIPKRLQEETITRVKIIGRMDIAEKRLPQDGRATVQVGQRVVDLRIASLPTSFGERVVIRLLEKSARVYTMGEIGMDPQTLARFRELIRLEHGLILVTGPTGSGKSTTLYGALQEVNSKDLNVVTLIRDTALTKSMQLLRDDGLQKILAGTTTVDEVLRVTMQTTH